MSKQGINSVDNENGHQRDIELVDMGNILETNDSLYRKIVFVQIRWKHGRNTSIKHTSHDVENSIRCISECHHLISQERVKLQTSSNNSNTLQSIVSLSHKRPLMFLFFHGNHFEPKLFEQALQTIKTFSNYGMFVIKFRGFTSDYFAKGSQEEVYKDAKLAMDYLLQVENINIGDIVCCGYSMGTYSAIKMAVEYPDVHSVLLFSPIESLAHAANFLLHIPLTFTQKYLHNQFNSYDLIDKIKAPIFMIHGVHDQVLPLSHAENLFENAKMSSLCAFFITTENHYPASWQDHWLHALQLYT